MCYDLQSNSISRSTISGFVGNENYKNNFCTV